MISNQLSEKPDSISKSCLRFGNQLNSVSFNLDYSLRNFVVIKAKRKMRMKHI